MDITSKHKLLSYLMSFISESRKTNFDKVLDYRTRHLTVVLEDVYQSQNASAVMRTCDIYGIQDLHVIENENPFDVNPNVVMGSAKWVDLYQYNELKDNTEEAFLKLKSKGYKIVATSPHANSHTIHDLPLDQKTALCFGTELTGLSDLAMDLADDHVVIPMYGFTESFNISVSAAICLSHLTKRIHDSEISWKLNEYERLELLLDWATKSIQRGDAIRDDFLKKEGLA